MSTRPDRSRARTARMAQSVEQGRPPPPPPPPDWRHGAGFDVRPAHTQLNKVCTCACACHFTVPCPRPRRGRAGGGGGGGPRGAWLRGGQAWLPGVCRRLAAGAGRENTETDLGEANVRKHRTLPNGRHAPKRSLAKQAPHNGSARRCRCSKGPTRLTRLPRTAWATRRWTSHNVCQGATGVVCGRGQESVRGTVRPGAGQPGQSSRAPNGSRHVATPAPARGARTRSGAHRLGWAGCESQAGI